MSNPTRTSTTITPLEQALDRVRLKSRGRTRYENQEPYDDELMLTEIERLRAVLSEIADHPTTRTADPSAILIVERCREEGCAASLVGVPRDSCPYSGALERAAWLEGYGVN